MPDVPIDLSAATHLEATVWEGLVWTSRDFGYFFGRDGDSSAGYWKSISQGLTWGEFRKIAATSSRDTAVWYEKWTPGDSGTKIELARLEGVNGGMDHYTLDTNGDALSVKHTVDGVGIGSPIGNVQELSCGIVKARNGNLYAHNHVDSTSRFFRSTDGGVTWVERASVFDAGDPHDWVQLLPGNETDTADIWAIYFDISAGELSLKIYDDSANSWSETLISSGITYTNLGIVGWQFSAVQRHSDNHVILWAWDEFSSTADVMDLLVWDITSSASITAKTTVITTQDAAAVRGFIDQTRDHLYVAYARSVSPISNWADELDVFYQRSVDGGTTWQGEVKLNQDVDSRNLGLWTGHSVGGAHAGRFMPVWFQEGVPGGNDLMTSHANSVPIHGNPTSPPEDMMVQIDWNNDGDFEDLQEDISVDVVAVDYDRGREAEVTNTPGSTCTIEVNDPDGDYSPENTSSRFGSGNVTPGRLIRVTSFFNGKTLRQWKGRLEKITPHPGHDQRSATLFAVDGFDQLSRAKVNAPEDEDTPFNHAPVTDVKLGHQGVTKVSGVNITFGAGTPDTITRASGSFVTDGYKTDMMIRTRGAADDANISIHKIASVTATVLNLTTNNVLFDEGPLSGITIEAVAVLTEVLDVVGWATADRVLDDGVDVLSYWWVHREDALPHMHKLEDIERSFIYIDEEGRIVYEDRNHRFKDNSGGAADHLTAQFHFNETMKSFDYELSSRPVRNEAVVTGHKRVAKASAKLYGTQDRPRVPAGGSITFWVDLSAPANSITPPVANTDYKANTQADSSGTDLTANVTIVTTHYGQSVKLVISNSATQEVFLVPGTGDPDDTLVINGTELDDDVMVAIASDATSQTTNGFGVRSISIDNVYQGNFNQLKDYADWLVSRFKDPQPDFTKMIVEGHNATLLEQILTRKISDRITATTSRLGISAKAYFINKMVHAVEFDGFHTVTYSLARASDEQYWVLGVVGLSELGTTTFLGF